MAEAAGHKFGQFIGEFCERAIEPLLQEFAGRHGLYLDKAGDRPARSGKKIKWIDSYGNTHNLDYVLERGGAPDKVGTPVAFIESAWRRCTKHSRSKAQEIQGAVLPIRDKHRFSAPFMGCALAGVYTKGALEQLRSIGFKVLYFPYDSVTEAFDAVGVDARFDEGTPDAEFRAKMRAWEKVSARRRPKVWAKLLELNRRNVDEFMDHLERTVRRRITAVRIVPLHGAAKDCVTVDEAVAFVDTYDEAAPAGPLVKYEVLIRYDNGDKIEAQFQDKATTVEFLQAQVFVLSWLAQDVPGQGDDGGVSASVPDRELDARHRVPRRGRRVDRPCDEGASRTPARIPSRSCRDALPRAAGVRAAA